MEKSAIEGDVDFTGEISSKCHSMDPCVRWVALLSFDEKKPFNKSERVTERVRRPKSNRLSQTDRKELRLDEDYDVGGAEDLK